ncbi:MAG TPA: N-acetyltransferase [Jatrophihabitantaceae bacterium]
MMIRPETPHDIDAVRDVHVEAFADDGRVARLVDVLRAAEAPLPPVSLVATVDDRVVGHVMLSAGRLDAPQRLVDVLVLSPMGVRPDHQNQGIGTQLVTEARHAAEQTTVPLLFLEGSPAYYGARGFRSAGPVGFRKPSLRIPDAAFQIATLAGHEPWMTGTLVYSEPFWALDCVGPRGADVRDRPEPTSW